jgi:hypothetical protein
MIGAWVTGIVRTRFGRMLGTVLGVAVVVALLVDPASPVNQ